MGIVERGYNSGIRLCRLCRLCAVAVGVLCGVLCVRYPALVLLPLGALLAAGTALSGIALHTHPGIIAAEVFGSVAASQLTYVAVSLTRHLVRWRRPPSHLIPQVQAAIGQELRTQLDVPRKLPAGGALLLLWWCGGTARWSGRSPWRSLLFRLFLLLFALRCSWFSGGRLIALLSVGV
jgi:hypothetical protein